VTGITVGYVLGPLIYVWYSKNLKKYHSVLATLSAPIVLLLGSGIFLDSDMDWLIATSAVVNFIAFIFGIFRIFQPRQKQLMKKLILSSLALISMISCDVSTSSPPALIKFEVELQYDSNDNNIINPNELIGFNLVIQNLRNDDITDIRIIMDKPIYRQTFGGHACTNMTVGHATDKCFKDFSSNEFKIELISPGKSKTSNSIWINEIDGDTVRLGNQYIQLGPVLGGENIHLTFDIEYNFQNQKFIEEFIHTYKIYP
jgi:hypothetical protein